MQCVPVLYRLFVPKNEALLPENLQPHRNGSLLLSRMGNLLFIDYKLHLSGLITLLSNNTIGMTSLWVGAIPIILVTIGISRNVWLVEQIHKNNNEDYEEEDEEGEIKVIKNQNSIESLIWKLMNKVNLS